MALGDSMARMGQAFRTGRTGESRVSQEKKRLEVEGLKDQQELFRVKLGNALDVKDKTRQEAWALDDRKAMAFLESGNFEALGTFLDNREKILVKQRKDPKSTRARIELNDRVKGGDQDALTELTQSFSAGELGWVAAGLLPPRTQEQKEFMGQMAKQAEVIPQSAVSEEGFVTTRGPEGGFKEVPVEGFQKPSEAKLPARKNVQSSEFLPNGGTIQILKDGTVNVTDPEGNKVPPGPERAKMIAEAQAYGVELQGNATLAREEKKVSIKLGKDAFEKIAPIRKSILNMDNAISALKKGASTGVIESAIRSVRSVSIELDNLQGAMGLDIIGATSFGNLSDSERQFALDVALPTDMEPAALTEWVIKKRDAQQKMLTALRTQAKFFSKGGTISELLEKQEAAGDSGADMGVKETAPSPGGAPEITTQEQFNALPSGALFIEDGKEYRKP